MLWRPCLVRSAGPDGEVRAGLGDPLVDDYLRFVAARSRPNTVLAIVYDLKVFFLHYSGITYGGYKVGPILLG